MLLLNQSNILKILALLLMTLDHYSIIILLNEDHWLRSLGRAAFPLFVYLLTYNYLYNTKDKIKYISRLTIFAVISQPIYMLAFQKDIYNINILGTFAYSLSIIYIMETIIKTNNKLNSIMLNILVFIIGLIYSIYFEYGPLGYIFILSTSLYLFKPKKEFFALPIITLIILYFNNITQTIGAFSAFLYIYIIKKINIQTIKINKWVFYGYYPAHLLILYFLKFI